MQRHNRQIFRLIWLAVIALCIAASVFVLFFTSCTKGGTDTKADDVIIPVPEDYAVPTPKPTSAPDSTPEPTADPGSTPEAAETPVSEPAG